MTRYSSRNRTSLAAISDRSSVLRPLLAALGARIRDPLRFSKQFLYEVGRVGDRVAQETLPGPDAQHRKENAPSLGERNNLHATLPCSASPSRANSWLARSRRKACNSPSSARQMSPSAASARTQNTLSSSECQSISPMLWAGAACGMAAPSRTSITTGNCPSRMLRQRAPS